MQHILGGILKIWHKGKQVEFDWSCGGEEQLQWAAFYGDFEHRVMEVTSGHRITLTYNLYYSDVGNLAQPVADPKQLALYSMVREMYENPGFMSKGRILEDLLHLSSLTLIDDNSGAFLGFFCNHQYAHSQSSGRRSLPGSFKGVDLAVFAAFKALGLKVHVKPIMAKHGRNGGLNCWGGLRVRAVEEDTNSQSEQPKIESDNRRKVAPKFDGEYGTVYAHGDSDDEGSDYYEDEGYIVAKGSVVGTELHGVELGGDGAVDYVCYGRTCVCLRSIPVLITSNTGTGTRNVAPPSGA